MRHTADSEPDVEIVAAAVAATFMVPRGELQAASRRTAAIALARQSAMYLAHVELGMTFAAVGRAFGRARTTAMRACETIERRRDQPALDAALANLANALRRDLNATRGAAS